MNYLIDTLYDLSQKSGRPAEARRAVGGRSDRGAAGTGPQGLRLESARRRDPHRLLELGRGLHQRLSARPVHHAREGRHLRHAGHADLGAVLHAAQDPRRACSTATKSPATRRRSRSRRGMGAWVNARLKALPAETRISMWSRYIAGEYGGMNEVMARLFRLTGERAVPRHARSCSTTRTSSTATPTTSTAWPRTSTRSAAGTPTSTSRRSPARSRRSATRRRLPYYQIATNFWDIVNRGYMYSIGGVAGARNPNNAECFTAQPDTLWENGFATRRPERNLRDLQPAEARSAALHVRPDREVHGSLRARALQPHPRLGGRRQDAGNTYHVPLNPGAQKRFGNAEHERLHLLQRHGAREQHQAAGHDLFPAAPTTRRSTSTCSSLDADLARAEGHRAAGRPTFPTPTRRSSSSRETGRFDIKVRVPRWATRGFFVKINGRAQPVKAAPGAT